MSLIKSLTSFLNAGARSVDPSEALKLVEEGSAVLVDVREADEWAETGVAKPAELVSLSELRGPACEKLIARHQGKEFIFYCHSGGRSAAAARAFAQKGLKAANAGGFSDWVKAGLPTRKV